LCVIERGARAACVLHSFLDFSTTQASGADPNTLRLAVDQCSDWLKVGLEDPLGLVIRVTDVMTGLATFATEVTCKCHRYSPSSSRMDTHSRISKYITGSFVLTSKFDGVCQRSMGAQPALFTKHLLQTRIRACDGQSRRSALRHTARVCLRASRLRVSVSLRFCTRSQRTFMNNAG
jgi:hypothetical protein